MRARGRRLGALLFLACVGAALVAPPGVPDASAQTAPKPKKKKKPPAKKPPRTPRPEPSAADASPAEPSPAQPSPTEPAPGSTSAREPASHEAARDAAAGAAASAGAEATSSGAASSGAASGPTPSSSDDGVERLDLGGGSQGAAASAAPAASSTAAPTPAPADDEKVEARAWVRSRTYAGLDAAYGAPGEPPLLAVPYGRGWQQAQLFARVRYARGRRFEIVAGGLLTWDGFLSQSPTAEGGTSFDTRARFEPSLREAYLGWFWSKVDLRAGLQRTAWGKSDLFAPNDVLQPRELRDPYLADAEVARFPVTSARLTVDLDPITAELVWVPFFEPDRVDVYGSPWALIQPSSSPALRGLAGALVQTGALSVPVDPNALGPSSSRPKLDGSASAVGGRLRARAGDVDASAYYHYGYTPFPRITPNAAIAPLLAGTVPLSAEALAAAAAAAGGAPLFEATYARRHHVGVDAEAHLGSFVFRGDVAYDSARAYFRPADGTGVLSNALETVVAAEYQPGEVGNVVLLEASYLHLFDAAASSGLLGAQANTVAVAAVARWVFFEHLELEGRGTQTIAPTGTVVRASVGWKQGGFEGKLGGIFSAGEDSSLGGYFRQSRGAYALLRYAF